MIEASRKVLKKWEDQKKKADTFFYLKNQNKIKNRLRFILPDIFSPDMDDEIVKTAEAKNNLESFI